MPSFSEHFTFSILHFPGSFAYLLRINRNEAAGLLIFGSLNGALNDPIR